MISKKINSLIFCRKCNSIPLIEIVPKEYEIKIFLSCKCLRQQLIKQETFFKYYYYSNNMEIEENKEIKNEKLKKLINIFDEYKNYYMNNLNKIKDDIENKFKNSLNKIQLMIDINKKFNQEIDKIIKILIKNYEMNPNDNNNIENIIKNIQINSYKKFQNFDSIKIDKNISSINKIIELFLNENYIIASDKYQIISSFKKYDFIIELNKNIFAALKKNESIKIFDIKNHDNYLEIKKNLSVNNILIEETKRYLISSEDEYFAKFRDLNEIIKKFSESNYLKNSILFPPLYELKHDNSIISLINLKNNLIGISDKKSFNIYKYDINGKNCQLISKLDIKFDNLKLIKIRNKDFISSFNNRILNIYEIPSLILRKEIQIQDRYHSKIVYEQMNDNELIIGENYYIKIINIENDKCKYISKKINFDIMSIKILKDGTILIGGRGQIKRLFWKNLEDLPCLISIEDYSNYYEDYYDYAGLNLINFNENENDVLYINELSDGKILIIFGYDIKIYGINLIDNFH